MVTRDDEKQLTTYEMFFGWEELYMDTAVPNQVFINLQLHLADARYMEYVADGYVACLGGLRYACRLSDEEKAEVGTDNGMALHIFNLTDADRLNGKVVEETTVESATEAPTEAPEVPTEAVTNAPAGATTEAPVVTESESLTETKAQESGCGSVIGMSVAAVLMAAAAAVALKKKD